MANESDLVALARTLQLLTDTDTEEQVFILPTVGSQSWHLDVVELQDEDGPRFAVYAEYGGNLPFDERRLPLPEGSFVDADEGSSVTVTFGELTPREAADVLGQWASILSNDAGFSWQTTWD